MTRSQEQKKATTFALQFTVFDAVQGARQCHAPRMSSGGGYHNRESVWKGGRISGFAN